MSLLIVLVIHTAEYPVEPVVTLVGIKTYGAGVVGYGLAVLVLPNLRDSPQIVQSIDIWIKPDGLRHIMHGSAEILQAELGYSPVLPRTVQVRLENYYLVKILDGEYIVLVMQGYLTAQHQPVGVILSSQR